MQGTYDPKVLQPRRTTEGLPDRTGEEDPGGFSDVEDGSCLNCTGTSDGRVDGRSRQWRTSPYIPGLVSSLGRPPTPVVTGDLRPEVPVVYTTTVGDD